MPGHARAASVPPERSTSSANSSNHSFDRSSSTALARVHSSFSKNCSTGALLDPKLDPVLQLGGAAGDAAFNAARRMADLCSNCAVISDMGTETRWILPAFTKTVKGGAYGLMELVDDVRLGSEEVMPYLIDIVVHAPAACAKCPIAQRLADRPLHEALPIMMVAMIMATIYFGFVGCCLLVTGASASSPDCIIFNMCFALALVAYHQGVATDPGEIPASWRDGPGVLERIACRVSERKKKTGEVRFCSKEKKYKPDRSHYCAPLQHNVLRMDHYCPWMSTCIGHFNHKFFLLFLFYTVIAVNIALAGLVRAMLYQFHSAGSTVLMAECTVLTTLLSMVLTPFFVLHCWLLCKNMTTIEFCEQRGWELQGKCASCYDVGVYQNICSVMGQSVCLWFLPVGGPASDGLSFPRRESNEVLY